jgi:hypothetical protein
MAPEEPIDQRIDNRPEDRLEDLLSARDISADDDTCSWEQFSPAANVDDDENDDESADADEPSYIVSSVIDWKKVDFRRRVTARIKTGPTVKSFEAELVEWQSLLHSLPSFDENEFMDEISNWDLNIPSKEDFTFDPLLETYARLVAYRTRLTFLYDLIYRHYEALSEAQKSLKSVAIKLATGAKHDKEAYATHAVLPFTQGLAKINRLKAVTEQVFKNIEFAAAQMERLMRERQSLARINQGYAAEGQGHTYQRHQAIDSGEEGAEAIRRPHYDNNGIRVRPRRA